MLLGNDIAGGLVRPSLEVLDKPLSSDAPEISVTPKLYPACVVTHAQARKDGYVTLADSVLRTSFSEEGVALSEENNVLSPPDFVNPEELGPSEKDIPLPLTRENLSTAQIAGKSLKPCFKRVVSAEQASHEQQACSIEQNVLMCQWYPLGAGSVDWGQANALDKRLIVISQ